MPKFHTDITPIRKLDNEHLRCEVSLWGHLLFGIEITPPFKSQNALVRKAASIQATKTPIFGYKYIASFDGPPDADYPTVLWTDNTINRLQMGKKGTFYFGDPTERDIGDFRPIVDALKSLPVLELKQTAYSLGSMVQRNDKSGRIL